MNTVSPEALERFTAAPCERSVVDLAAEMIDAVRDLPAVPTLDWCDRAAGCLARLQSPCAAAVLIAVVTPEGRIAQTEAAGVAFSTGIGSNAAEEDLRCRVGAIESLEWRPSGRQSHGRLSRMIGPDWRQSGVGGVWRVQGLAIGDVHVGVASFDAGAPERRLIALAAMAEPIGTGVDEVFGVTLDRLARRAAIAIGSGGTSRSAWISPREQQVLDLLVLGHSVREIAESLDRSSHTVHDHVKALHRKLAASSRGELIARALGHISAAGTASGRAAMVEARPLSGLRAVAVGA